MAISPIATTTEELEEKQLQCKNAWREANDIKENLWKQYLCNRAQRAHESRNIEVESALKQIINAETAKALHKQHGGVTKGKHSGSLTKMFGTSS